MEENKDTKGSWIIWPGLIILAIFAIIIIVNVGEGLYYFMASGGWKWLLAVGGLIGFSLLVAHAAGE